MSRPASGLACFFFPAPAPIDRGAGLHYDFSRAGPAASPATMEARSDIASKPKAPVPAFRLAIRRSGIVHGVALAVAAIWPLVNTLIQNREKPEEFVLIDLKMSMTTPEPQVARPQPDAAPEPPKPEPPKPEPPKPEPPKPEPPKPEPPKPAPSPLAMATPDDKPKTPTNAPAIRQPHQIKISTTTVAIARAPRRETRGPQISEADFRRLVKEGIKEGDFNSLPGGGEPSLFAPYYLYLRSTLYASWQQPDELAGAGLVAQVRIRVARDGTVLSRALARGSGHGVMDDSVMKAVNRVSKLRPLPAGYTGAYKDITVDFELTGGLN